MTAEHTTAALVGAAGGVGTTRLTVETAAMLARDGRSVAVLDVALGTQGLVDYVPGRIDPDATDVYTDGMNLADTLVDLPFDVDGSVAVCPARAPFEALARAKTASAATRFEGALDDAASVADHVLVDVPPVATNPSVAAVTAADRVGVVTVATDRGHDALQRLRGRLDDVGADHDCTIVNRSEDSGPIEQADALVPESGTRSPVEAPAVVDPDPEFAPAIRDAAEALFETELAVEPPDSGLLSGLR